MLENISEQIGRSSYITLLNIGASHPNLESFELVSFREPPLLQERFAGLPNDLLKRAMGIRESSVFSFWDSLLAATIEANSRDAEIIRHALFHNEQPELRTCIESYGITLEKIENAIGFTQHNEIVALSSRVNVKGNKTFHLPLLDFHCDSSEGMLDLVKKVSEELISGDYYVIDSGKSFHLIGTQLLSVGEWTRFLHRALLLNPIVDSRFIAHQLIQGECKLRLTKSTNKTTQPKIVEFVRRH